MFLPNEQGIEDIFPTAYLFVFFMDEVGTTSPDTGSFKPQNKKVFNLSDTFSDTEEGNHPPLIDRLYIKGLELELLRAFEEAVNLAFHAKGFSLLALTIEDNKIYTVVSASTKPEVLLFLLKSVFNEKFDENKNFSKLKISENTEKICYLWKNEEAAAAIEYIKNRREPVKKKSMPGFTG